MKNFFVPFYFFFVPLREINFEIQLYSKGEHQEFTF